jgi:hypothetical protein
VKSVKYAVKGPILLDVECADAASAFNAFEMDCAPLAGRKAQVKNTKNQVDAS